MKKKPETKTSIITDTDSQKDASAVELVSNHGLVRVSPGGLGITYEGGHAIDDGTLDVLFGSPEWEGAVDITSDGFVKPIAGNLVAGRLVSLDWVASQYPGPANDNRQLVISVHGVSIQYIGTDAAALCKLGEDPKNPHPSQWRASKGVFSVAVMAFMQPLAGYVEKVKAEEDVFVRISFGRYIKKGTRARKQGECIVTTGSAALPLLNAL